MINDQVVLWICQNNEVYLQGDLPQQLSKMFPFDTRAGMAKIVMKYCQVMEQLLKEGKCVSLDEVVMFYGMKLKNRKDNSSQIKVKCQLVGKAGKVVEVSSIDGSNQKNKTVHGLQYICQQVSSLLMLELSVVSRVMMAFSKAVYDLIRAGKQLDLNLTFSHIILSKTQFSCSFRKSFLKDLNTTLQFSVQEKESIVNRYRPKLDAFTQNKENKEWKQCWREVKDGNLLDYPSLKEIKDHLDKGHSLYLRYKDTFQK